MAATIGQHFENAFESLIGILDGLHLPELGHQTHYAVTDFHLAPGPEFPYLESRVLFRVRASSREHAEQASHQLGRAIRRERQRLNHEGLAGMDLEDVSLVQEEPQNTWRQDLAYRLQYTPRPEMAHAC